jgi:hypothetical protein
LMAVQENNRLNRDDLEAVARRILGATIVGTLEERVAAVADMIEDGFGWKFPEDSDGV